MRHSAPSVASRAGRAPRRWRGRAASGARSCSWPRYVRPIVRPDFIEALWGPLMVRVPHHEREGELRRFVALSLRHRQHLARIDAVRVAADDAYVRLVEALPGQ